MNRILCLATVLVALVAAAFGTTTWLRHNEEQRKTPVATATAGGITATPGQAGWTTMEAHHMDNSGGGYNMPPQMMPGAPEGGDMRLGVPITLVNDGDRARNFDLATEFVLEGGAGAPRELHSDTFGHLERLNPGSAVDGVLYFDTVVPGPADPPLRLVWQRDGDEHRLAVNLSGQAPHAGHES